MNYRTHPLTEAQLQAVDSGEPVTGATLPDLERALADDLLRIRGLRTRERWGEVADRPDLVTDEERRVISLVWAKMPGSTCFADAARLVARKENP